MRRIALVALLAACGGSYGSGATGGGNQVGNDSNGTVTINWTLAAQNAPVTVTLAAGNAVRWHNGDGTTHTITPDTTPPPNAIASLAAGATSAAQTIDTPGTYHYHCSIHPGMKGTLIVQ